MLFASYREQKYLGLIEMKKQLLILSLPLCAVSTAYAAGAANADILAANNQIGLQITSTDVRYSEYGGTYGTAQGLMDTERGTVPGYTLSASLMKDVLLGNDYFKAQYSHNEGSTNYVGSYIGGGLPYGSVTTSSTAKIDDYSLTYGKGFNLGSQAMVTPYLQYGYHEWKRGLADGNQETYSNNYYGAGAKVQYAPIEKLVLGANYFSGRTMQSKISTNQSVFPGESLGNSAQTSYGFSVDYAISKDFHANLGYEHTQFKYGASPLYGTGFFEPNSTTKQNTVSLGFGYAF